MKELTCERLRELLHYDPLTGVFTRLVRTSNRINVGDIADAKSADGHIQFWVDGKLHYGHRLAWFYMTGSCPPEIVDHEDTDPSNNRWLNLRDGSNGINQENHRVAFKKDFDAPLGVHWSKAKQKWVAQIGHEGKTKHLGYFDDPFVAHQAYLKAKRELHLGCTL